MPTVFRLTLRIKHFKEAIEVYGAEPLLSFCFLFLLLLSTRYSWKMLSSFSACLLASHAFFSSSHTNLAVSTSSGSTKGRPSITRTELFSGENGCLALKSDPAMQGHFAFSYHGSNPLSCSCSLSLAPPLASPDKPDPRSLGPPLLAKQNSLAGEGLQHLDSLHPSRLLNFFYFFWRARDFLSFLIYFLSERSTERKRSISLFLF